MGERFEIMYFCGPSFFFSRETNKIHLFSQYRKHHIDSYDILSDIRLLKPGIIETTGAFKWLLFGHSAISKVEAVRSGAQSGAQSADGSSRNRTTLPILEFASSAEYV